MYPEELNPLCNYNIWYRKFNEIYENKSLYIRVEYPVAERMMAMKELWQDIVGTSVVN